MARYSKNNSNFIIRKKHQSIEGGTILERDWSTLGERHVIESGKRKVYGDSGFLFTDSTRPGLKKRNRSGEWDSPLTLDDLKYYDTEIHSSLISIQTIKRVFFFMEYFKRRKTI